MSPVLTVRVSDGVNETVQTYSFESGSDETILTGDIGGLVPAGTTARIVGNINLTADLIVEGLLTGVDTFHCQGNGHSIFFQNGGRADLHGKVKGKWGEWGSGDIRSADTTGWQTGDRLAVAPTKAGVFAASELVWSNWTATRPVNSPDFVQVDGTVAKPEVLNLGQSIVFENLARGFHFHDSAGIQLLSDVKFLNCGTAGVLGNYPCHFHMLGDASRGSLLERVVVEGGRNHAFVPHGSHGIDFIDCAAYNTINDAFWWDPPANTNQPSPNDSSDILYDHPLVLGVTGPPIPASARLTGFFLGKGATGIRCINGAAVGVVGGNESSGFEWPESAHGNWEFRDCVAHNNKTFGIFAWQNSSQLHVIEDFHAYRNGVAGIEHGAYGNFYLYRNIFLTDNPIAFIAHAVTRDHIDFPDRRLIFEDMLTDGSLLVTKHNTSGVTPTFHRRCTFTAVVYNETNAGKSSYNIFEDCGLVPADFTFTLIQPASIIEIKEAGVLTYRRPGAWS